MTRNLNYVFQEEEGLGYNLGSLYYLESIEADSTDTGGGIGTEPHSRL